MSSDKVGPARVQRIIETMRTLSLKSQAQVLDSLKDALVLHDSHGVKFVVRSVSEYKRNTKRKPWDEPIEDWIASFPTGASFFDIGANTGAFSLLAAKLHGDRITVYAIEPAFETFEALVHNIVQNESADVIIPLPVGLSDATRIEMFNYHRLGAGTARHVLGESGDPMPQPFEPVAKHSVLAFRLDDLIEEFRIPPPTHVKLDVDGLEYRVIAGAQRALASADTCDVWVEVTETDAADPIPGQLTRDLEALGFSRVREITRPDQGETYPRVRDLLFVRRSRSSKPA